MLCSRAVWTGVRFQSLLPPCSCGSVDRADCKLMIEGLAVQILSPAVYMLKCKTLNPICSQWDQTAPRKAAATHWCMSEWETIVKVLEKALLAQFIHHLSFLRKWTCALWSDKHHKVLAWWVGGCRVVRGFGPHSPEMSHRSYLNTEYRRIYRTRLPPFH